MFGRKSREIKRLKADIKWWTDSCKLAWCEHDKRFDEITQFKRSIILREALYVDSRDRADHLTETVCEQSEQIKGLKAQLAGRTLTTLLEHKLERANAEFGKLLEKSVVRAAEIDHLKDTLAGTARSYNESERQVEHLARELANRPTTWAYGQACRVLSRKHIQIKGANAEIKRLRGTNRHRHGQIKLLEKQVHNLDFALASMIDRVETAQRLYANNIPALLRSLPRICDCARAEAAQDGEVVLSDGPDLEAGAKLVKDIEESEDRPGIIIAFLAWFGGAMGL